MTVEDSVGYNFFAYLSLTNLSSMCGVNVMSGEISLSLFKVVAVCLSCLSASWISIWQLLEVMRNGASPFTVWFFPNFSVMLPDLWGWSPFGDNVQFSTSFSCMFWVLWAFWIVLIANSMILLSNLWWLVDVSMGCCHPSSGIDGNFVAFVVSGLSIAVAEWRLLVQRLGRSLDTFIFIVLCVLSLILILSRRSSVPRRRSICCIGSKIKHFLLEWLDLPQFSQVE